MRWYPISLPHSNETTFMPVYDLSGPNFNYVKLQAGAIKDDSSWENKIIVIRYFWDGKLNWLDYLVVKSPFPSPEL